MLSGEPSVLECHLNEENLNEEQEERMAWGGGKVCGMRRNVCGNPELTEGCCT